jgi:hypothetical protein
LVVAQQLFTTVKRGNAIAQNRKTAHRITVSRFFGPTPTLPKVGREKEKKKMKNRIVNKI